METARHGAFRTREGIMSLLTVVLVLVVVGVLLWLVNNYIPMAEPMKKILNGVVVLVVVIWLLRVFGVWSYLDRVNI